MQRQNAVSAYFTSKPLQQAFAEYINYLTLSARGPSLEVRIRRQIPTPKKPFALSIVDTHIFQCFNG